MFFKKSNIEKPLPQKGNYIVVIHNWFVDSKGFKSFTFSGLTLSEVEKEAKALTLDNSDTFSKCAYTIIEVL